MAVTTKKSKKAVEKSSSSVTKTVMEWLYEKKLYEQKIKKCEEVLATQSLFYATSKILVDTNTEKETIERATSLLQKYDALIKNYELIKQALLEFNANTKIEINGREYSIARALELYKEDRSFNFKYKYLSNQCAQLEKINKNLIDTQKYEVANLEAKIYGASSNNNSNTKIQSQLETRRAEYTPYIKEAIPVLDTYHTLSDEHYEFINQVNIKINIANVNNTLTLDLV